MKGRGPKMRAKFDRYHIVDGSDGVAPASAQLRHESGLLVGPSQRNFKW